jgi:hypothetical protein
LCDIHPAIELIPTEKQVFNLELDFFWRAEKQDGIYSPAVLPVYSGQGTSQLYIGRQVTFSSQCKPNKHVYLNLDIAYFKAGTYLKEVTAGKNIFLIQTTLGLKF